MTPLTGPNLKSWFDAHPERFKDGEGAYLPTGQLWNILRHPTTSTWPNPISAQQVLKPITFDSLVTACPIALISVSPADDAAIQQKIDAGDNVALSRWAVLLNLRGQMSVDEKNAVITLCQQTQNDPNWRAVVSATDLETEFGVTDIDDLSVQDVINAGLNR